MTSRLISCLVALGFGLLTVGNALADGLRCSSEDLIGSAETPGLVIDVDQSGHFVFAVDRVFGLYVFDVSDPSSPINVGHFADEDLVDDYLSVQAVDGLVYLGVRTRGDGDQVLIFDMGDLGSPALLGTIEGPEVSNTFQVFGGHVFFVSWEAMTSFDVSDPTEPVFRGEYSGVNLPGEFVISDEGIAYVTDLKESAWVTSVLDVSDPSFSDPFSMLLGTIYTRGRIDSYAISDGWLYAGLGVERTVDVYEFQEPGQGELIGTYNSLGFVKKITVEGDRLILSSLRAGVEVVDITSPHDPRLVGLSGLPRLSERLVSDGRLMYVASGSEGLQIIRKPHESLPLLGSVDLGEFPNVESIAESNGHVYASLYEQGLRVFDVRGSGELVEVGQYTTNGNLYQVQAEGMYVYVSVFANEEEFPGLHIIDVSDPGNPQRVGYERIENIWRLVVQDQIVYAVADGVLHIIDASDAEMPVIRSTLAMNESVDGLAIGDGVLFGVSYFAEDRLMIVDVSDLDHPSMISTYSDFPGLYVTGVGVDGDTLYVTVSESDDYSKSLGRGHPGGLFVLDVTDLTQPQFVGAYEGRVPWGDPVIRGSDLFVSWSIGGLFQFDISDPTSPRNEGSFYGGPGMTNVTVVDDQMFVANSSFTGSLYRLDASDSCSRCVADINGDSQLVHFDVSHFVQLYFTEDPHADFNFDGEINFFDVAVFIESYLSGCG